MADIRSTSPYVQVRDLKCWFELTVGIAGRLLGRKPGHVRAVDGVSFDIERGSTFALIGESGCGKSTVAKTLVGLNEFTGGTMEIDGRRREPSGGAVSDPDAQIIFQDPYSSLNPRWTVHDIIAEPIRLAGRLTKAETTARVEELLLLVNLAPSDRGKYPHEFSGGQRQRISIARALAASPRFMICDEPTSALDVSVQAQILNLMTDLQRRLSLTYLFISHNLAVVRQVADTVGVMYLGRIVEKSPADQLFSRPAHPYTRAMLEAVPDIKGIGVVRDPIPGETPSAISPPNGCAFNPRCPYKNARCESEAPDLKPFDDGMVACHAIEEGRLPVVEIAAGAPLPAEAEIPADAPRAAPQIEQLPRTPLRRLRNFAQSDLLHSFRTSPAVVISFLVLVICAACAVGARFLAPHDILDLTSFNLLDASLPPVWEQDGTANFPLGTDQQGRDMLSLIIYGMRISLLIGGASVVLAVVLGVTLGLVAGYFGGTIDSILMRVVDIQLSFPAILVAILVNGVVKLFASGADFERWAAWVLILSIGITGWMQFARTVRASTMVEVGREYVHAARVMGRSRTAIMFQHILPNVLGPVLVLATIFLGVTILTEASLSFLGVGLPPTQPSLGTLIRIGGNYLFSGEWWVVVFPGIALAALILAVNVLGDWLRDALNPKLK